MRKHHTWLISVLSGLLPLTFLVANAQNVSTASREVLVESAELIITYAGIVGQPTSVPVQGEKPEY